MLDFYHTKQTRLLLSIRNGQLDATLVDELSGISVPIRRCRYEAAELAIFLAQQPAAAAFIFAIGTEREQGQELIATRSPYAPFVVGSYRSEWPQMDYQVAGK